MVAIVHHEGRRDSITHLEGPLCRLVIVTAGREGHKQVPHTWLMGKQSGVATLGNDLTVPQKTKYKLDF